MHIQVVREAYKCDFCTVVCDFCSQCKICKKDACYECENSAGVTYPAHAFLSSTSDAFYCHACIAAQHHLSNCNLTLLAYQRLKGVVGRYEASVNLGRAEIATAEKELKALLDKEKK